MAGPNDADGLFDYDAGLDDILREVEQTTRKADETTANTQSKPAIDILGIDEELKIPKRRAPIPKLDEARLLSPAGIPKLRRVAKTKLKLKGKGHEFSDAARLLNFYQLWLDDLFPRAKFADGLSIIEKLGHSRRLQVMRKEWIDEGKEKMYEDRNESDNDITTRSIPLSGQEEGQQGEEDRRIQEPSILSPNPPEPTVSSILGDEDQRDNVRRPDDEGDLFIPADGMSDLQIAGDGSNKDRNASGDDVPDEDDLDMLLAGGSDSYKSAPAGNAPIPVDEDYDNDWEAMQN